MKPCAVCGRTESHCRRCHFVHDHIKWLDGTVTAWGELKFRPAPFKTSALIQQAVRDSWASYEVSA